MTIDTNKFKIGDTVNITMRDGRKLVAVIDFICHCGCDVARFKCRGGEKTYSPSITSCSHKIKNEEVF